MHASDRIHCRVVVYSMAQASKAIIPKDAGGPWGRRMGVSVKGSLGSMLRVGAYSTKRLSSTDYNRYSLVVMNCSYHGIGVQHFC
jgi:hypothetical protein